MKPNFPPYYIFEGLPTDLNSSKGIITFYPLTIQNLIYRIKDIGFKSFIKNKSLIQKIKDQTGLDISVSIDDSYKIYNKTGFFIINDSEDDLKIFFCVIESNTKDPNDFCTFA